MILSKCDAIYIRTSMILRWILSPIWTIWGETPPGNVKNTCAHCASPRSRADGAACLTAPALPRHPATCSRKRNSIPVTDTFSSDTSFQVRVWDAFYSRFVPVLTSPSLSFLLSSGDPLCGDQKHICCPSMPSSQNPPPIFLP